MRVAVDEPWPMGATQQADAPLASRTVSSHCAAAVEAAAAARTPRHRAHTQHCLWQLKQWQGYIAIILRSMSPRIVQPLDRSC